MDEKKRKSRLCRLLEIGDILQFEGRVGRGTGGVFTIAELAALGARNALGPYSL